MSIILAKLADLKRITYIQTSRQQLRNKLHYFKMGIAFLKVKTMIESGTKKHDGHSKEISSLKNEMKMSYPKERK